MNQTRFVNVGAIARLGMTFKHELDLDKSALFDAEAHRRFLEIHNVTEKRRDAILRSVLLLDAALAVLVSGHSLKVPYLELSTADFPAIQEVLLFLASISWNFAWVAFANVQAYVAIIDQFGIRASETHAIDPDFLNASFHRNELFLKIFRPKMNIWGPDFYEAQTPFKILWRCFMALTALSLLAIPIVHYLIILIAIFFSHIWELSWIIYVPFIASVLAPNIAGLMVLIFLNKPFNFKILDPGEPPATLGRVGSEPPEVPRPAAG